MIDYGKLNEQLQKEQEQMEHALENASLDQVLKMKDLITYHGMIASARCGYHMRAIRNILKQRGICDEKT